MCDMQTCHTITPGIAKPSWNTRKIGQCTKRPTLHATLHTRAGFPRFIKKLFAPKSFLTNLGNPTNVIESETDILQKHHKHVILYGVHQGFVCFAYLGSCAAFERSGGA